jgi:hypothetical protein
VVVGEDLAGDAAAATVSRRQARRCRWEHVHCVPVVQASDGAVAAAIGVVVATLKRDRHRLGALQIAAPGIGRLL